MSGSDADRWRQVRSLFDELADLGPRDREDRLVRVGAADPALRHAVQELLDADAVAGERLAEYELRGSDPPPGTLPPSDPLGISNRDISHFRVLEFLASGGMGAVYVAEDLQLQRRVALKFPLPHQTMNADVKARFIREAKAAALLDHPNVCSVYEVGESPHGLFLAMPLYPGETLKEFLGRKGALSPTEALEFTAQIVAGLTAAHAAGIVHRDLKPGNVIVLPDGTLKILDFGLAKARDATQSRSRSAAGTISYMAPEQIRGSSVDVRADLWSVGVLLYEMLTGGRPFAGEHEMSIVHAILHDEPRPPSAVLPQLPRRVEGIVLLLLQKRPVDRYASAAELLADIRAVQHGDIPARRAPSPMYRWVKRNGRRIGAAFVLVSVVALAAAGPRLTALLRRPTDDALALRFYTQGREYERHGPLAAAESLYHRAVARDSGFALARARLAVVYAACRAGGSRDCYRRSLDDPLVDRVEQIRSEAEAALRLQPQLADAHFAMGLYWEQRERPGPALAAFERARRGMRRSGELHSALGRAYRAQGRWDDAIRELERGIALDPRDAQSMADLATTYSRLRRYPESIRSWNRYLALVPDAYQGQIIRGHVYLRWQGTVDTLVAVLRRLPPDWRGRMTQTRVLVARFQQRPAEALAALDGSAGGLEDPQVYYTPALLRAQVYADMGDSARARRLFDSARVHLERAAPQSPEGRAAYRTQLRLGLAYAGLGRAADAKRAADSALKLMPPSRSLPAGTLAMAGAAEIFAQIPEYHGLAIALLDQLLQMPAGREASVPLLSVDPAWKALRSDPRFQQLLVRYAQQ